MLVVYKVLIYSFVYSYFENSFPAKAYKRVQQCPKVLWVMVVKGVLIEAARCFSEIEENSTNNSLFQALCQWGRLKKRAGDERGLVGKNERSGEPASIVLKSSFRYTSSWYTL